VPSGKTGPIPNWRKCSSNAKALVMARFVITTRLKQSAVQAQPLDLRELVGDQAQGVGVQPALRVFLCSLISDRLKTLMRARTRANPRPW
jgi:hypothetical protein